MPNLEEGYGFVGPRSQQTARALLDAAKAVGEESHVVRATIGGYYAPVRVVKAYEKALGAKDEDPVVEGPKADDAVPDDSWKVAEIKTWANDHGVSLGDATKKADMLAAIRETDKEE